MAVHSLSGAGIAILAFLVALLLAPVVFKFLPVGTKGLI
jgi:hypothetical protein